MVIVLNFMTVLRCCIFKFVASIKELFLAVTILQDVTMLLQKNNI